MKNYIWIVFIVLSHFGYSQVPSDTINYNGAIFCIVLPVKYNYKLVPKILRNKIVLVNKAENKVQCLVSNYTCGTVKNQQYVEHRIGEADLTVVFNAFISKEMSTFLITNVNCSEDFSGKCKPIIGEFKMERIK